MRGGTEHTSFAPMMSGQPWTALYIKVSFLVPVIFSSSVLTHCHIYWRPVFGLLSHFPAGLPPGRCYCLNIFRGGAVIAISKNLQHLCVPIVLSFSNGSPVMTLLLNTRRARRLLQPRAEGRLILLERAQSNTHTQIQTDRHLPRRWCERLRVETRGESESRRQQTACHRKSSMYT